MKSSAQYLIPLVVSVSLTVNAHARQHGSFYEGLNIMIPTMPDQENFLPWGIKMGVLFGDNDTPRFSIGPSFSYHGYGFSYIDFDYVGYKKLKTAHNIYSFNLDSRINLIDNKNIRTYIKPSVGLNIFNTRSFVGTRGYVAMVEWLLSGICDEYDPDCMEDVHENRILLSQNDITPNLP